MLNALKQLFSQESVSEGDGVTHSQERVKVATCVLLLEIARADDEFTNEERSHIVETLCARFSLNEEDAHELIDLATQVRKDSRDLWGFTSQINQGCSVSEKHDIIEEVWRVVCADGSIDGHEKYLAHQLGGLLNLTHGQIIELKMKVLDELRG